MLTILLIIIFLNNIFILALFPLIIVFAVKRVQFIMKLTETNTLCAFCTLSPLYNFLTIFWKVLIQSKHIYWLVQILLSYFLIITRNHFVKYFMKIEIYLISSIILFFKHHLIIFVNVSQFEIMLFCDWIILPNTFEISEYFLWF